MIKIVVNPGVCGFCSRVEASATPIDTVSLKIDSKCEKILKLASAIQEIDGFEVMKPISDCEFYKQAGEAGLHACCPVLSGIIKAVEAEMGFALPRDTSIHFE